MSADLFLTGEFHPPGQTTRAPWPAQPYDKVIPFAGYHLGYNRSVLANRIHDLLTVIASAKDARDIRIVAFDRAGPWALLARALAGDAVRGAALDLARFDFDQVKRSDDEMMLPGALKYGGVGGLGALCASGRTALYNAPAAGRLDRLAIAPGVAVVQTPALPDDMIDRALS